MFMGLSVTEILVALVALVAALCLELVLLALKKRRSDCSILLLRMDKIITMAMMDSLTFGSSVFFWMDLSSRGYLVRRWCGFTNMSLSFRRLHCLCFSAHCNDRDKRQRRFRNLGKPFSAPCHLGSFNFQSRDSETGRRWIIITWSSLISKKYKI